MKRFIIFLLVLLLAVGVARAENAEGAGEAEALRAFLEKHYSVAILMGDECLFVQRGDFDVVVHPSGATVFQQMAYRNSQCLPLLRMLDDVFSVYPPGFFSCFSLRDDGAPGLRLLLVDELLYKGQRVGGMYRFTGETNDLWLSLQSAGERAIHHELGHAVEYRILSADPDAFAGWEKLNPEGFTYTGDFSISDSPEAGDDPGDWFARAYGLIDAFEDRACVFEALMLRDSDWWEARPRLQEKAAFLMEKMEPLFPPVP